MSTVRRSAIIRMMPISRAPVLLRSRNHLLLKLLMQSSQVWILDKKTTLPKKNFKKITEKNLDVMMKKLWESKKQISLVYELATGEGEVLKDYYYYYY
jgi:hypothetical protein